MKFFLEPTGNGFRGAFPDPAGTSARITITSASPGDAAVSLEEQNPVVAVEEVRRFSSILYINAEDITFPANQWFELRISATNLLDSQLVAPVSMSKITGFIIEESEKTVLFAPFEEKEIVWRIRVDRQLKKNQQLTGRYRIISLGEEEEAGAEE